MNDVDRWIELSRELEAAQAEVKRLASERDFVLFCITLKGKSRKELADELQISKQRISVMLRRAAQS